MGRSPFSTTPRRAGVGHGGAQLLVEVVLGEEEQAVVVVVSRRFGGERSPRFCGLRNSSGQLLKIGGAEPVAQGREGRVGHQPAGLAGVKNSRYPASARKAFFSC